MRDRHKVRIFFPSRIRTIIFNNSKIIKTENEKNPVRFLPYAALARPRAPGTAALFDDPGNVSGTSRTNIVHLRGPFDWPRGMIL